jgi:hypothetical protein
LGIAQGFRVEVLPACGDLEPHASKLVAAVEQSAGNGASLQERRRGVEDNDIDVRAPQHEHEIRDQLGLEPAGRWGVRLEEHRNINVTERRGRAAGL